MAHNNTSKGAPPVKVVVGVDFGLRYSRFAYSPQRPNEFIFTVAVHGDAQQASASVAGAGAGPGQVAVPVTAKALSPSAASEPSGIPTALLYVRQGKGGFPKVVLWGLSAQQQHLRLPHQQQQGSTPTTAEAAGPPAQPAQPADGGVSYTLVTGFKQYLETEPSRLVLGAATDPPSATVTAQQATTHFLMELRRSALQRVWAALWGVPALEVHWALAVPSAWSRRARRELKACAKAAGMWEDLHLVPDAQAAAAFCFHRRLEAPLAGALPADLWPCGLFCVVDGGTGKATVSVGRIGTGCWTDEAVDTTATAATFPECGGDRLDREFVDLVAAKVGGGGSGGSRFRDLAAATPVRAEVVAVMAQWEAIKRGFGSGSGGTHRVPWHGMSVTLEVSQRLIMSPVVSGEGHDGLPRDQQQQQQSALVSIELSEEEVRGVFNLVADELAGCITRWMTARNLTHLPVLLVGCLASSPWVAARVRESVRRVGVPDRPEIAVVQGAVHVRRTQMIGETLLSVFFIVKGRT